MLWKVYKELGRAIHSLTHSPINSSLHHYVCFFLATLIPTQAGLSSPVTTQIFPWHTADVRSDSGCPTLCEGCNTLHYRTPCAQLGQVSRCFPFITSQIFLWYPADVWLDSGCPALCNGHGVFALSDNLCPTWPSSPFLLRFKYFSDILRTSGRTPDVRICAMATAFLYYQTTCTQLGRVFRCFSFHNISPFLLPDLFSLLPCLSN